MSHRNSSTPGFSVGRFSAGEYAATPRIAHHAPAGHTWPDSLNSTCSSDSAVFIPSAATRPRGSPSGSPTSDDGETPRKILDFAESEHAGSHSPKGSPSGFTRHTPGSPPAPVCPPTPVRTPYRGHQLRRQSTLDDTRILKETDDLDHEVGISLSGSFTELFEIGSGSFSVVYIARSVQNGRLFAIKRSCQELRSRRDRTMHVHEFEIVESLTPHPNIVRYHRAWQEERYLFIQMELCAGGNMQSYLQTLPDATGIEEQHIWWFLGQMSQALHHMHSRGVVHLDVKLDNAFIMDDGSLKLGDFGLASRFSIDSDGRCVVRNEADMEGDSRYLAPEGLDPNMVSPACDIFSLGVAVWEMMFHRPAPQEGPAHSMLRNQGWEDMRGEAWQSGPAMSRSDNLRNALSYLLHPDPAERPTAEQILARPEVQEALACPEVYATVPSTKQRIDLPATDPALEGSDSYVSMFGGSGPPETARSRPPLAPFQMKLSLGRSSSVGAGLSLSNSSSLRNSQDDMMGTIEELNDDDSVSRHLFGGGGDDTDTGMAAPSPGRPQRSGTVGGGGAAFVIGGPATAVRPYSNSFAASRATGTVAGLSGSSGVVPPPIHLARMKSATRMPSPAACVTPTDQPVSYQWNRQW